MTRPSLVARPSIVLAIAAACLLTSCGQEPTEQLLAPNAEGSRLFQRDDAGRKADADSDSDGDGEGGPRFSAWGAPVLLGPVVNSDVEDLTPFISRDGLSLYFASPRPLSGQGAIDIWVSRRPARDAAWEAPLRLGPTVNVDGVTNDNGAMLSRSGRLLLFQSNRPGGFGGLDLYVSAWSQRDETWSAAQNLGSAINSPANEAGPFLFEDDETTVLYFQSNRVGGPGGNDIYASTWLPDGTFAAPVLVAELSSPLDDQRVSIRRDGREAFLSSTRAGTLGGQDIWVSKRSSTSDPWGVPENLGPTVNTEFFDAAPSLSFDGTALYFHSAFRPGNVGGLGRFDIVVATREKLTKP